MRTPQRDSVVVNVELNGRSFAGGDVAIDQEVEEVQDKGSIFLDIFSEIS